MTRETYEKHHQGEYTGKHGPKWYNVWRVIGPAGPEEELMVYGIKEAAKAVEGCWDYTVSEMNREIVSERKLRQ